MTSEVLTAEEECGCADYTMSRRAMLRAATLAGAVTLGSGALTLGSGAVPVQAAFGATSVPTDTLVVLFLRGGADWLSLLAPLGDPTYAPHRPTIGLTAASATRLDDTFALHPGLAPLMPWWQNGTLGFVHAVGSPDPTRSHFDAQKAIELGGFDNGRTLTGWLDRYLTAVHGTGAFDAVARGSTTPLSLSGPAPSLALSGLANFGLPPWLPNSYANAVAAQFTGVSHPLAQEAKQAFGAIKIAHRAFPRNSVTSAASYGYPSTPLGSSLSDVARLVKAGLGTRIVTVDHGGWDMHSNLGKGGGVSGGMMHGQAIDLGSCLAAFATDLGPALANVTLVTVTDFGRRVTENASGGLDHGHGQAMLLLGGAVKGGRVTTSWPGLAAPALDNGDLAGTTDIRSVLGTLLSARLAATDTAVRQVFPGWQPSYLDIVAHR